MQRTFFSFERFLCQDLFMSEQSPERKLLLLSELFSFQDKLPPPAALYISNPISVGFHCPLFTGVLEYKR